ncbi:MAG: hypothetical protein UT42_C0021G0002 [Candidatus Falkowbacteria bacterium GW2011_GWA2_39_24]|uniref:Bacterial spore germination immunoglobulin-like domain-containing protein n=1 Tax=Candidatus Falkowbacteria bacterium GW2011_GWA2_39_24 TaxID=1618634 RepID=A0A0G0NGS2_9BACT|nr:MAG: hypothetical protein UT42_C0021G0002 [Candidatus Falkowbacteria bacterium GW2011_GWA2_39_24]
METKLPWYRSTTVWMIICLALLISGAIFLSVVKDVTQLNNPAYLWTMGLIVLVVIILAIIYLVMIAKGRIKQQEVNYCSLFIIGICWFPLGIIMDNMVLWGLGMVLVIIGLANKKRWAQQASWSELSKTQRSWKRITITLLLALIIAGFIAYILTTQPSAPTNQPTTEEPVIKATLIYKDLVRLETPQPETIITSPLVIKGEARGTWFFEASFPVVLTDWDGLIIAQGIATAQSNWMTEDYVPFTAELTFDRPSYGDRGALILQKDNPSGLPEHDDALEITVYFK